MSWQSIITTAITALIGGLVGWLVTQITSLPAKMRSNQEESRLRLEKNESRLSALERQTTEIRSNLAKLEETQKQSDQVQHNIAFGVQALLRDNIQAKYLYLERTKAAEPYDKANISNLFAAYEGVGGNGYVKELYEQMMKLPIKGEEDNETEK